MEWQRHMYRVGSFIESWDELPSEPDALDLLIKGARKRIEPWLSGVFQAEHLNLLVGSGLTAAIGSLAGSAATSMAKVTFGTVHDSAIDAFANATAKKMERGRQI